MIKYVGFLLLMLASPPAEAVVSDTNFNPANPAGSGYNLVFDDEFSSLNTIDMQATGNNGYNWYITRFFGYPNLPASNLSIAPGGGLVIAPTTNAYGNQQLTSAGPNANSPYYVGNVWTGGWYVEVSIKFDNTLVTNAAHGWPSVWAMSIEHLDGDHGDAWPGQAANYNHFIENDLFEYLNTIYSHSDVGGYAATLHDWYGIYNVTCGGWCGVGQINYVAMTPGGTTTVWTNFHKISQLWVSGRGTGNPGYIYNYFDNTLISRNVANWIDNSSKAPVPSGNDLFSIIDDHHLALILGTSLDAPMTVQYVHVWQHP